MTENEAIKLIKIFPEWNTDDQWLDAGEMEELTDFCIKALGEIRQYREIGTVKELKEIKLCAFSGIELASIAIAMQELRKYKAIGTVEECMAAVEKQKAREPDIWGDGYDKEGNMIYDMYDCPNCKESYEIEGSDYNHCPNCGQALSLKNIR